MRETTTVRRRMRLRPVRPAGWWFDVLLLAGFVALTVALAQGHLIDADLSVRQWSYTHRVESVYWIARVLNYLGQGGWLLMPVAGGLAVAVGVRARSVRPLLLVAAVFALIYLTIGPLKWWANRAAPSSKRVGPEDAVRIFVDTLPPGEYSMSYPSGHVANAIVWYGAIALLLAALLRTLGRPSAPPALSWAIRVLPPAILVGTTTYLNYHWLTDSIAGLLLGVFLDRLVARVPWDDVPLPGVPGRLAGPALFTSTR